MIASRETFRVEIPLPTAASSPRGEGGRRRGAGRARDEDASEPPTRPQHVIPSVSRGIWGSVGRDCSRTQAPAVSTRRQAARDRQNVGQPLRLSTPPAEPTPRGTFFATHQPVNYCATCGASLPPSSRFCPRCGADLTLPASHTTVAPASAAPPARVPPVPASTPQATGPVHVEPAHPKPWWIVPLVIIGVVVIAFLLLMGMPFGSRETNAPRATVPETETIAEGTPVPSSSPIGSATIEDVGDEVPPTATTIAPPAATTMTVPPVVATTPATNPAVRTTPPARTTPAVTRSTPPPPAEGDSPSAGAGSGEISDEEAISTVRGYIVTRNYYNTNAGCIRVSNRGYRNAGYTLDVHDSCEARHLGRWRVDARTREVFRQQQDGRFLRP